MSIDEKELKHIEDCIMVDTLGLRIPNVPDAKLPKKYAEIIDDPQDGEGIGWSKGSLTAASGKQSFRVRGIKKSGDLLVEGSNAFHYQGHNIVSSNNVTMSAYSMLHAVKERYQLTLKLWRPYEFLLGEGIEITRVDPVCLLKVYEGLKKGAITNALALAGFRSGINTSVYVNSSAYFDQNSQMASMKAYDKVAEMEIRRRKRPLPDTPNTPALMALAEQTIRFEAVFRKKYLKNRFGVRKREIEGPETKQLEGHENKQLKTNDCNVSPATLTPRAIADMFCDLIEKYNLKGDLRRRLDRDELWAIPRPYRDTVAHWQHGMTYEDLLKMFDGKKLRLQEHQRVIKNNYSIDIFAPPPGEIDVRIELGEILRIENFIPVPATVRTDSALFYERDMRAEWYGICQRMGMKGMGAVPYIDPNRLNN